MGHMRFSGTENKIPHMSDLAVIKLFDIRTSYTLKNY